MNQGILYALGAYIAWGIFPVYWKLLHNVPALQLLCHRIIWSFITLIGYIIASKQWHSFRTAITTWRVFFIYLISSILIGINWLTYVWAVNEGFIIETSLGYFINPLLSVLLGVLFLHERLRAWQWLPICMAALGVAYLTLVYGSLPWIALTLATTFGIYGLVKKIAPLGSLYGLTLETGILFVPSIIYLVLSELNGKATFLHLGSGTDLLLVGAGLVTTVPLLMFASAAQRIPLTLLGIFQYISPTIQFFLGVVVYKESFRPSQFIGFGIVWAALLVFWVEGFFARRNKTKTWVHR